MRGGSMVLTVVLVAAALFVAWHLPNRAPEAGPLAPSVVNASRGIGGTAPPPVEDINRPTTGYVVFDPARNEIQPR